MYDWPHSAFGIVFIDFDRNVDLYVSLWHFQDGIRRHTLEKQYRMLDWNGMYGYWRSKDQRNANFKYPADCGSVYYINYNNVLAVTTRNRE